MKPLLQVVLGLVLCIALLALWLLWPVCVPIPDAHVPAFGTARSLEERAAAGEPFACRAAV